MKIREQVFERIVNCFKLHGAVTIDTPVFERKVSFLSLYQKSSTIKIVLLKF
jgi:histidyl-tRNA synthetase